MLFDSHAHLESPRFAGDVENVIARAREAGVERVITCGSDLPTSRACIAIAQEHEGVYAAAGIHPHEAHAYAEAEGALEIALAQIASWDQQGAVVAVGEIGLDYHYHFSPRVVQHSVFAAQLVLATEIDLPVIMHNRESDEDLVRIVDGAPAGLRGVVHCFLSDRGLADWALARGFYLGIGGPLTFKGLEHLAAIVREVPLERLLIETDSPYLAPHPHRGKRNEPALVRFVAQAIADIRGLPLADVAAQTAANARELFGAA